MWRRLELSEGSRAERRERGLGVVQRREVERERGQKEGQVPARRRSTWCMGRTRGPVDTRQAFLSRNVKSRQLSRVLKFLEESSLLFRSIKAFR